MSRLRAVTLLAPLQESTRGGWLPATLPGVFRGAGGARRGDALEVRRHAREDDGRFAAAGVVTISAITFAGLAASTGLGLGSRAQARRRRRRHVRAHPQRSAARAAWPAQRGPTRDAALEGCSRRATRVVIAGGGTRLAPRPPPPVDPDGDGVDLDERVEDSIEELESAWATDDEGGPGDSLSLGSGEPGGQAAGLHLEGSLDGERVDAREEKEGDKEGDGGGGAAESTAIQEQPGAPLVYEKIMPEDALWKKWIDRAYSTKFDNVEVGDIGFRDGSGREVPPELMDDRMEELLLRSQLQFLEEVEKQRAKDNKTPFDALKLATPEDRELFSKVSTAEAQATAAARVKAEQAKPRIADDGGLGSPSPNAYVEIGPRPAPEEGEPDREAVDYLIAKTLRIPLEKASKLIQLGAVWVYDDYYVKGWDRIMKGQKVQFDEVLRVFPNPERFKTCYVEDWRDRVKKVDQDFVVVDKPPLLPCFAKVSNGREALPQCLREALHLKMWGGDSNPITEDLTPCHQLDDEASGLVVLARHKKAVEVFDKWLLDGEVVFEYVALTTAMVEKGIYRHFYEKIQKKPGQPKPALYEEIPPAAIKTRQDYDNWDVVEMEVVATAPLPGDCAALRIRVKGQGWKERIRTQLAMLGAPVLNDQSAVARGTAVPEQVISSTGLLPEGAPGGAPKRGLVKSSSPDSPEGVLRRISWKLASQRALAKVAAPLAGAVDEETLRGPYGRKLQLLPLAREAADNGVPQTPQKAVPVALHLARLEFGGRVITCAPPAYWPEGAAAAVAVQLTNSDIKSSVQAYLIANGGRARFGILGGRFSVKVEWLEEHFLVDRAKGLAFASEVAKKEWEAEERVKHGDKAWGLGLRTRREAHRKEMMRIREKYVAPTDMDWKPSPTYKQIKKNKVKPVNS